MLSRPGKLNLLLNELNWLNINDFKQRLILQKTIYILTEMGMKFKYGYNWYVHGPYSPGLADDAYEIESNKEFYDREIETYRYKDHAKKIVDNFKTIFNDKKDNAEWLEIVSSLLFLKNSYQVTGDKLERLLISRKPKFEAKMSLIKTANKFISDNAL